MHKITVETDEHVTEYENVTWYGGFGFGNRWLCLRFADGSVTQIRASLVREIDIAAQP